MPPKKRKRNEHDDGIEDQLISEVFVQRRKKKAVSLSTDEDVFSEPDVPEDMEAIDQTTLPPSVARNVVAALKELSREEIKIPKGRSRAPQSVLKPQSAAINSEERSALELFQGDMDAKALFAELEASILTSLLAPEPNEHRLQDQELNKVFTEVGLVLRRYRSGPIPKVVKLLPHAEAWEQTLLATSPINWSAQATHALTRMFISQLDDKGATRYISRVLMPRLERGLEGQRKMPHHLFEAMGETTHKPAAFYKGMVLPLAQAGAAPKLAHTVAAILRRFSMPAKYSGPAIMRICQFEWSPTASLFLAALLDKGYTISLKCIAALVQNFLDVAKENTARPGLPPLPLAWQKALLVFVQRYGSQLTAQQHVTVLEAVRLAPHSGGVSAEVRRTLRHSTAAERLRSIEDVLI